MMLYLLRHGPAVDVGENGVQRDVDRMLSKDGKKRTKMVARTLVRAGVEPDRIMSSPLVRARETAELFVEELGGDATLEIMEELAPGLSCEEITVWLAHCHCESVLLVGHAPDLAVLAWYWVASGGPIGMEMKKAGCCCVSFDDIPRKGRGVLEWLIKPALLEAAGHD